jgi:hypothetical protein
MPGRREQLRQAIRPRPSVKSVFSVISPPIASMAFEEPAEWLDDLCAWTQARCTHREGRDDWGGLSVLHIDFAEWSVDTGRVPCARHTFETLLRSEGFLIRDGMVQGIFLTEDLWAIGAR